MRTLLNPEGQNDGQKTEKVKSPFSHYLSWNSVDGKWNITAEGKKSELKKPINLIVLDVLFTIKGGEIGQTEIFSSPFYKLTATPVKVFEKDVNTGRFSIIAEGPVKDIYEGISRINKARKSCYLYCYAPTLSKCIVLELSGYATSPFFAMDIDLAESPGLTINVEGRKVDPKPKWGERYHPIFTVWGDFKPADIDNALKVFGEIEGLKYLNFLQGIEEKKPAPEIQAEKKTEETQGTGDPW